MSYVEPMLDVMSRERHEKLLREAETYRLIKAGARRPGALGRGSVVIGGWLVSAGRVLRERYQPAVN